MKIVAVSVGLLAAFICAEANAQNAVQRYRAKVEQLTAESRQAVDACKSARQDAGEAELRLIAQAGTERTWTPVDDGTKDAHGNYVALVGGKWKPALAAAKNNDGHYMAVLYELDFDADAARKAGATDDQIASFVSGKVGFDFNAARKAGYSTADILKELSTKVHGLGPHFPMPQDIVVRMSYWEAVDRKASTCARAQHVLEENSRRIDEETEYVNRYLDAAELQELQRIGQPSTTMCSRTAGGDFICQSF